MGEALSNEAKECLEFYGTELPLFRYGAECSEEVYVPAWDDIHDPGDIKHKTLINISKIHDYDFSEEAVSGFYANEDFKGENISGSDTKAVVKGTAVGQGEWRDAPVITKDIEMVLHKENGIWVCESLVTT